MRVPGQGLTIEGRRRIGEVAAGHVGDGKVPGLVVLAASGGDVHVDALGLLRIGGPAVARDSIFRIASMTKPITAAATMVLVAEGLLALDEPVDRLLPELAERRVLRHLGAELDDTVPAQRPITTRDLLTFTCGFGAAMELWSGERFPIVEATERLALASLGPPDPAVQPEPDVWIAGLGSLPLMAQPGERWLYNTGAQVLGVLLARAAGAPLAEVLRSRLFEPLGMVDTAFYTTDTARLATGYLGGPDGLVEYDPPEGDWSRPPAFGDAAAGLVSTVDDMHRFASMLLAGGGEMLTAEAVTAMTTDQLTVEQKARGGLGPDFFAGSSWGFCQAVHDDGSYGWNGGLGTSWLVDPRRDLVVVVLTQRMFESAEPPAVHVEIQAAAYSAIG